LPKGGKRIVPPTVSIPYKRLLEDLRSLDQLRQNHAFQALVEATDKPIDWAYEVWDDLLRTVFRYVADNNESQTVRRIFE
jgi:hypothetical protein